jgi:large repetitive protein
MSATHGFRLRRIAATGSTVALGAGLLLVVGGVQPAAAAAGCGTTTPVLGQMVTCSVPGSDNLTVPTGATMALITAVGAGGGTGSFASRTGASGSGAKIVANAPLAGGTTRLKVTVGAGGDPGGYTTGGYGGGGSGVFAVSGSTTTPLVVAGGGGGGGGAGNLQGTNTGDGGDAGSAGTDGGRPDYLATGGGAGTDSAGGAAGTHTVPSDVTPNPTTAAEAGQGIQAAGTLAAGGAGESASGRSIGGRGGGGYTGGGGGGAVTTTFGVVQAGGGGGGSNFTAAGIASPTITPALNGNSVSNFGGDDGSVRVTFVSTPGTPTGYTVDSLPGAARLSFTPGADGGAPPVTYQYSVNGGTWTALDADTTASPVTATISGLRNGTQYSFAVRAMNVAGASTPTTAQNVTPARIPRAPGYPSATPGDAAASLSWVAPADNGGAPITSYRYSMDNGAWTDFSTLTGTSGTITGLTNGSTHSFRVEAVNSAGEGLAGGEGNTIIIGSPTAPLSFGAQAGNGTATLTWADPQTNNNSAITSWTLYRSTGPQTIVPTATGPGTWKYTVTGLTNGSYYWFDLAAVNARGAGLVSSVSIVPATVPGQVGIVTATAGVASATLDFAAPSDGGASITSYQYSATTGGADGPWTTLPSDKVVRSLTNGSAYTFRVRALNDQGTGANSPASNAVTPTAAPVITGISPAAGPIAGGTTITITGTTLQNATSVMVGDTACATTTAVSNTEIHCVTAAHAAGNQAVAVTTPFGTSTFRSTPFVFVDAPTIATVAPAVALTAGGATLTVTGTNFVAPLSVTVDGRACASPTPTGTTSLTCTVPASPGDAVGTVDVVVTAAGGAVTRTGALRYVLTPVITSVTATAPARGGRIVISGAAFTQDTTVTVGGAACGSPSVTDTSITCTAPGGAPGPAAIAVTGPGGTVTSPDFSYVVSGPSAPTALTATPGPGTATLTWSAPLLDGGTDLDRYEYSVDGGTTWTDVTPALATTVTVTGLTNGTAYAVQVRAHNSADEGLATASVAVTPRTVPDAPEQLAAVPGDQRADLTFDAPQSDGGNAITGYQYLATVGGTWQPLTTSGTGPYTATVTGLTNGTAAAIGVRAVNDAGPGASATVTVTPRTVPGAPTGLVAAHLNNGAVLTFSAPADNGGAPVTGYRYSVDGGTQQDLATTGSGSTLTARVSGLVNGTQYSITVLATNAAGTGAGSTAATVTPGPTVPGAPTGARISRAVNGDTVLTFPEPDNGGRPVLAYQYETGGTTATAPRAGSGRALLAAGSGDGEWLLVTGTTSNGSTVTVTVAGLATGQRVQIRAVNELGAGPSNDPLTVPRPPSGAAPKVTDGQFVSAGGMVYRIAGGAPIYVSSWASVGGGRPVTAITPIQLEALPQVPKDGTFVRAGNNWYRIAGGAPVYVSSWATFGGVQPSVQIDPTAVTIAGGSGQWSHLRAVPADGTFVSAAGMVYRIAGGAPVYVSTWSAFGGVKPTVQIDPNAIRVAGGSNQWSHLRATPADGTLVWAAGDVYVMAGGAPIYVSSWDAIGGYRTPVQIDPSAIRVAGGSNQWSHVLWYPRDNTYLAAGEDVYVVVDGVPTSVGPVAGDEHGAVVVDPAAVQRAGTGGVWNHLRTMAGPQ